MASHRPREQCESAPRPRGNQTFCEPEALLAVNSPHELSQIQQMPKHSHTQAASVSSAPTWATVGQTDPNR